MGCYWWDNFHSNLAVTHQNMFVVAVVLVEDSDYYIGRLNPAVSRQDMFEVVIDSEMDYCLLKVV